MSSDTIAAIATGIGNAGIGIVRVSGEEALSIACKIFKGKKEPKNWKSHTIHYGRIYDGEDIVDEVLVSYMKAPNSYTAEDTIEINCHGGILVTRRILDTVIKYGARPAEPGEFTKRAFLNGRMDLSQSEAVIDVINSQNELALETSMKQLQGSVRNVIASMRDRIIYEIAFIESALDDPEHISLEGYAQRLDGIVENLCREAEKLLKNSENGKLLREGIRTVIVGKPNAGKSSLLNLLVGEEKAIVTEVEGTTRDILEEPVLLGDIQLNLVDTAGIRDTEDIVEKIGVERAKKYAQDADLIIYVVDASRELDENDSEIIEMLYDKRTLVLLNKSDLDQKVSYEEIKSKLEKDVICISAKEDIGIDMLEEKIQQMFFHGGITFNDEVYITNARHRMEIGNCLESLKLVRNSIEMGMPEDFYSIDLMNAYEALGNIIGESVGEDLVNEIFSKFCMGK